MRVFKSYFTAIMMATLAISLFSCKTKKLATQPAPAPAPVEVVKEEPAQPVKQETKEEPEPVAETPSFNYSNIQFEFNSSILKTSSYSVLDEIAMEMKKYPEVKFNLNGHSSTEGSAEHNRRLSIDRATAVKSYLVNNGVKTENLIAEGFGESKPIASNDTEEGRSLNRRVEIKKAD